MPRSRSFTRLTMRVGLLHLGQSVDFVVSITFLRSPVFAILAIDGVFLLFGVVSAHTRLHRGPQRQVSVDGGGTTGGFNGAVSNRSVAFQFVTRNLPGD